MGIRIRAGSIEKRLLAPIATEAASEHVCCRPCPLLLLLLPLLLLLLLLLLL
jgi:hypothetical protein